MFKLLEPFIAFDLETTDVSPELGCIIQIGAVHVKSDLTLGAEFSTYIKPLDDHRSLEAMFVNGISEKTLSEAPTPIEALEAFEQFCFQEGARRPLLGAWGVYFDHPFLKDYYKRVGRKPPFSYRCLDLKSMAIWEASKRGQLLNGKGLGQGVDGFMQLLGIPFQGVRHDGLADIKNSMAILQHYAKDSQEQGKLI